MKRLGRRIISIALAGGISMIAFAVAISLAPQYLESGILAAFGVSVFSFGGIVGLEESEELD